MSGARAWMLAAALGCFTAGTAVGLLIPRLAEAEEMPRSEQEEEEYVCKLVADHGLSESQARSLRLVMQNHREQRIELLLSARVDELPLATQKRLSKLNDQTTNRIRVLLDPQQRAKYDHESRQGPIGPEHGGPSTATNR